MLTVTNLEYRIGGRVLIDNASVQISDGHKVGLIGRNGAGKTTFFNLLTGRLHADGGEITIGTRESMGTVAQEAPDGDTALIDIVLAADKERASLLAESETATDPERIAEIHTRLADIGAHSATARAATILAGLGFDEAAQMRPISDFSGGWKMRVALAAILFAEPDILLLDEPTNHLDLEAALWLEGYLASYPKTIILISHDRELLNKVPNRILHLENGKITQYTGNYDRFEQTKREAEALAAAQAAKQAAQREHIQKFVDRFRYKASKARQAQSRLKMLERMEPIMALSSERAITFQLPDPEELPPPILTMDQCSVGYGDNPPILKDLNLRIDMDDRIALLGANGNGKTTLLRMLAGRLANRDGEMRKSNKLTIGYFAQNQLDELEAHHTAITQILAHRPKWTDREARTHLGAFGFVQDKAETKVSSLSGGEKARLALACICLDKPHILLLDEPTNHLDMDSRQALVQALGDYQGAVILVSHDPYLVNACADRLWLVSDGSCRSFDGDLEEYKSLLLQQRREERRAQKQQKQGEKDPAQNKKQDRKARADARANSAHLRKAAKQAEKQVEKLQSEIDLVNAKLADPDSYGNDTGKLIAMNKKLADLTRDLEDAETAWLEAAEALEEATA
ncbi:ABC-F family ATP-binding cassette domain-containing protein [Aestuariispira insulae]|uniref:ATP-binding cassette subfamily F protein 3 n=1 Tax=Aestuariispira insulae TaxID=1461337 RepID=A0A3D9HMZ2_9PROT|nr:ABC-F family ATP-binding cassette domain-containing protein [Aestuariispira insulae]RED50872.1 ATP-binding cassette subfamily F protein 3 [Aestuariispira insulae]